MKIKDIMTRDIEWIGPQATLDQIALKMKDYDVGILPVVDNDRLIGIVTDRDVVIRGIAGRSAPITETKAEEIMSKNVLNCREDQSLEELTANMQAGQVRRMAVTDDQDRLVGMVSIGDLAMNERHSAGEALGKIAQT